LIIDELLPACTGPLSAVHSGTGTDPLLVPWSLAKLAILRDAGLPRGIRGECL